MIKTGSALLLAALLGLLAASVWWAYSFWTSFETEPLPAELWLALIGGVVFSILIGGGLMALLFYSSRAGYDDRAHRPGDRN